MIRPEANDPEAHPAFVAILVAWMTAIIAASLFVVRRDEKRLDEDHLERAWPDTSRDSALFGLSFFLSPLAGPLCVWFHFFRTRSRALWPPWRWSPKGFALGVAWAAGVVVVALAAVYGVAFAVGFPLD